MCLNPDFYHPIPPGPEDFFSFFIKGCPKWGGETIPHEGAIPSPCPPSPEKIVVTRIVGSVSYGFPCLCKSMENPKYVETKEVFGNDFFYLKSSLMRTLIKRPPDYNYLNYTSIYSMKIWILCTNSNSKMSKLFGEVGRVEYLSKLIFVHTRVLGR